MFRLNLFQFPPLLMTLLAFLIDRSIEIRLDEKKVMASFGKCEPQDLDCTAHQIFVSVRISMPG